MMTTELVIREKQLNDLLSSPIRNSNDAILVFMGAFFLGIPSNEIKTLITRKLYRTEMENDETN